MQTLQAFQTELTRAALFFFAIQLIALIIGIWITYVVIKCAIRDGINESRLGDRWSRAVDSSRSQTADLPPMRAER